MGRIDGGTGSPFHLSIASLPARTSSLTLRGSRARPGRRERLANSRELEGLAYQITEASRAGGGGRAGRGKGLTRTRRPGCPDPKGPTGRRKGNSVSERRRAAKLPVRCRTSSRSPARARTKASWYRRTQRLPSSLCRARRRCSAPRPAWRRPSSKTSLEVWSEANSSKLTWRTWRSPCARTTRETACSTPPGRGSPRESSRRAESPHQEVRTIARPEGNGRGLRRTGGKTTGPAASGSKGTMRGSLRGAARPFRPSR